jgi:hypothetical protein
VTVSHLPAGHPPSIAGAACAFGVASARLPIPMVDISPPARWQFPVHLCHSVSGGPGRPHLRPDPMTWSRLAEPTATPESRRKGAKKWQEVAGSGAFFEHLYTWCTLGGEGCEVPHGSHHVGRVWRAVLHAQVTCRGNRPSCESISRRRRSPDCRAQLPRIWAPTTALPKIGSPWSTSFQGTIFLAQESRFLAAHRLLFPETPVSHWALDLSGREHSSVDPMHLRLASIHSDLDPSGGAFQSPASCRRRRGADCRQHRKHTINRTRAGVEPNVCRKFAGHAKFAEE